MEMVLSKKKQGYINLIDKNVELKVIDSTKAQTLKDLIVKAETDEDAKNIVSLIKLKTTKQISPSQSYINPKRRTLQEESSSLAEDSSEEEKNNTLKWKIIAAILTIIIMILLYNTIGIFGIAIIGLIAGGILK